MMQNPPRANTTLKTAALLALVCLMLVGCMQPEQPKPVKPYTTASDPFLPPQAGNPVHPSQAGAFGPGIYFEQPIGESHTATLKAIAGNAPDIRTSGNGFDIKKDRMVYPDQRGIILTYPNQTVHVIPTRLYMVDRPSFSQDGKKIAVQASATDPSTGTANLDIFVIDLDTEKIVKISNLD